MRSLALILAPSALLWACNNDVGIAGAAQCDGVAQESEETVDSPFDADGDGFFDGANPNCAATYPEDRLDCHDQNADVNPEGFELTCNGIDDDCDSTTPDTEDEYCGDDVDNDCDSRIDEGCDTGDTGNSGGATTYNLDNSITYQCAYSSLIGTYAVNISFNAINVQDTGSQLLVSPTTGGGQPGTMNGPSTSPDFLVSNIIDGLCAEEYTLDATFTSGTEIDGTFSASFTDNSGGLGACSDCSLQTWTIHGTAAN